jgi:hypothetical protein
MADRVGILKRGRKITELDRVGIEREDLEGLYIEAMQDDDALPGPRAVRRPA